VWRGPARAAIPLTQERRTASGWPAVRWSAVLDNRGMIPDHALQQWLPTEQRDAQALVRAVCDRARALGVALSDPPPEPTNCCDSGCIGCVWEAWSAEVAYWRDESMLRWA
jgi:hypothetical protein